MESDLLEDSFQSELETEEPIKINFEEAFNNAFPFYLSIGMTYEQYWNGSANLVIFYRKAHEMQTKRKNQEMWLQGMYVYDAVLRVSPILQAFAKEGTTAIPYVEQPYPMTEEERRLAEEEQQRKELAKLKAGFEQWAENLDLPERSD